MKTLKKIIIESNKNNELIDNSCVDEFIKYLQGKSIIQIRYAIRSNASGIFIK